MDTQNIYFIMSFPANAVANSPKPVATHLALSALSVLTTKYPGAPPTVKSLTAEAQALLPQGTSLPEEFSDAVGEL
jgi:NEDD8-activating enzyme E1 regulatory subunit